jgi:aerobic carbon-monoxide dehydrogenase medium subunit
MYAIDFQQPKTLADAASALASTGGRPLAGGQSLVAAMKLRLSQPGTLVDLSAIAELKGIRKDGDRLIIGAMTRHAEIAASDIVKSAMPALASVAEGIGDRQVRNMGTLGGSLANNDPAADYPAAVLALGATVKTNKRSISADDFFKGLFSTALEDGEIITAVSFPVHAKAGYSKFNHPASRFALTAVFVARTPAGDVRVAATGASQDGVMRVPAIEAALKANWSAAAIDGVTISADGLMSDIHGTSDYRANLIKVMAQRAVTAAG